MQLFYFIRDINVSFNRDKYVNTYLSFLSNSRFLEIWCLNTPITSSYLADEFRRKRI